MLTEERCFWLSFVGPEGFRGACVVRVTSADLERLRGMLTEFIELRRAAVGTSSQPITDAALWLGTAMQVAREHNCNPGGEVMSAEVPGDSWPDGFQLYRLYSKRELQAFGEFVRTPAKRRAKG